jgi:hypothetical protein
MKKKISVLIIGFLLISSTVFADDVSIDSDGNVITGISSSGNLEVTGASAEKAVVGLASGTGGTGVHGKNITYGNYGILGGFYSTYDVGVYGFSSSGYAGYFQGDAKVTGDLTVDGLIIGETDPVFSAWDKSTGVFITESQITDLDHFTNSDETDPNVNALGKATLTCSPNEIVKWNGSNWVCATDEGGGSSHSHHSLDAVDGSPTDVVYVNSIGNVGIGTTSPGGPLHIEADSGINIRLEEDGSYTEYFDIGIDSSGDLNIYRDSGEIALSILDLNGNVGIGELNPDSPLHIIANGNGDNIHLEENAGGEDWQLGIDADGNLNFKDSGTTRITFQDGGNVGIGTTSATEKLEISGGNIKTSGVIKVDGSGDSYIDGS